MIDFLQSVDPVGINIQYMLMKGNDKPLKLSAGIIGFLSAFLVFRIIAIYYAFMAYREFKACEMEHRGGMGAGLMGGGGQQRSPPGGGNRGGGGGGWGGAGTNAYNGNATNVQGGDDQPRTAQ